MHEPFNPRRRRALASLGTSLAGLGMTVAGGLALPVPTRAEQRPIRLVVPFPPGGGTDIMGRLLAQALAEELGQTVVVDNVAGATGTLGSAQVARSAADGHTLLLGISATHAIAPSLYRDVRYLPERDFVAIARIAHGGNILLAHPSYPANTLAELIAEAKRSGATVEYASWGNGSGGHLAAESIRLSTGIDMRHIPYKGVAQLMTDLIGGHVPVAMGDMAAALPQLESGKVKALAVTAPRRSSLLPQVPTFLESGVSFDTESWYALFAPAGLADANLQRLRQASERALLRPVIAERIRSLGMEPDPIAIADFNRQWHADIETWAGLIRSSGARVD